MGPDELRRAVYALGVLALAATACGCAPPTRTFALAAGAVRRAPAGSVTISVGQRFDWPYVVERAIVTLDGALMYRCDGQEGCARLVAGAVAIGPVPAGLGTHTVNVQLGVRAPCTPFDRTPRRARVSTARTFRLGDAAPGAIAIELYTVGPFTRAETPFGVRAASYGEVEVNPLEVPIPARCAPLADAARAACAIDDYAGYFARLRASPGESDAVRCLRAQQRRADALAAQSASGLDRAVAAREAERVLIVASRCVADASPECGPTLTVDLPACSAPDPRGDE